MPLEHIISLLPLTAHWALELDLEMNQLPVAQQLSVAARMDASSIAAKLGVALVVSSSSGGEVFSPVTQGEPNVAQ